MKIENTSHSRAEGVVLIHERTSYRVIQILDSVTEQDDDRIVLEHHYKAKTIHGAVVELSLSHEDANGNHDLWVALVGEEPLDETDWMFDIELPGLKHQVNRFDKDDYTHQHAHVFAYALQSFFDYNLMVATKPAGMLEAEEIIHTFVMHGGTFVDIRGVHETRDLLLAPYDCGTENVTIREMSLVEYQQCIDMGILYHQRNGEVGQIIQFLTDNKEKYLIS